MVGGLGCSPHWGEGERWEGGREGGRERVREGVRGGGGRGGREGGREGGGGREEEEGRWREGGGGREEEEMDKIEEGKPTHLG